LFAESNKNSFCWWI